jgi:hypothetical protein
MVRVLGQARAGVQLEGADGLALQVVVAQDERGNLVLHAGQELVAPRARQLARGDQRIQQDLDVDLDVRGIDAAELSMKSVLSRPPASAYSMRPRCERPRLPPSPTTFAAAPHRSRAPHRCCGRRPRRCVSWVALT